MATRRANVDCSVQPLDLSFHPKNEHILAASLVDGTLEVHDLSALNDPENDTIVSSIDVHEQQIPTETKRTKQASARAVLFSSEGERIFTGGSAGDVCGLDTERSCSFNAEKNSVLWRIPDAGKAVHCLHQLPVTAGCGPLLASGDEDGGIQLLDERLIGKAKSPCVFSWNENTDYISSFGHGDDGMTLLASSADCTLSVMDLRKASNPLTKKESFRRSDDQEDELLSLGIIKNGKKVVCGTQQGVVAVWSWGTWGDISDRFPGHPASIDAILKVDEDTILTGSSDGLIRLVQIHPDKLLGVLGDHDGYPVEKLQFNANRSMVGSVSHDNLIRLWDARILDEDGGDDDNNEEEADKSATDHVPNSKLGASQAARSSATANGSDDEWDDDEESDIDEDSDGDESDEDNEEKHPNHKRAKRLKTENEKFFEDL